MVRIGVTGGIACGKSLVGRFLGQAGVRVREADDLAHEAMRRGQAAYGRVVERFGEGILGSDGEIDRRALGARVFGNPEALAGLNALVHPEVARRWGDWLAGHAGSARAVAVIVPLLFEAGFADEWDVVICVAAPASRREAWLRERGMTRVDIEQRLAAQMPLGQKMTLADHVVYNSGGKANLREQTDRVLGHILNHA